MISYNGSRFQGHVTALSVAPQYRRMGLAQQLTAAFERGCDAEDAWFVDLFVREGNETAGNLYRKMGYSIYRRVSQVRANFSRDSGVSKANMWKYYCDDPTGRKAGEDAFDMRKPLSRDKKKQHIRKHGESFRVSPEDVYG